MAKVADAGIADADPARPLPTHPVAEALADRIRARIFSGALRPGELLNQKGLAQSFGVSRIPLREALKVLDGEGLLVHERGVGTRVRLFDEAGLKELYEVRQTLEGTLAEALIEHVTDADYAQFDALLAKLDKTTDVDAWCDLNTTFHDLTYTISRRATTGRVLQQLNAQAEPYRRMFLRISNNLKVAQSQHHDMIELLRAGEAQQLSTLMSEHIYGALGPLRPVVVELQNDLRRTRGRFTGATTKGRP